MMMMILLGNELIDIDKRSLLATGESYICNCVFHMYTELCSFCF